MAFSSGQSRITVSLINRYKAISLIGVLVLLGVQFFLLYNTYRLQNEHYFLAERPVIIEEYGRAILNDKLFPGGAAILDRRIDSHMTELERLYMADRSAFDNMRRSLYNDVMAELKAANNFDSILNGIESKHHIKKDLAYALTIDNISVTFDGHKLVSLYDKRKDPYLYVDSYNSALIGGTLRDLNPQNQLVNLTVSSPAAYSYRITFNLYVDTRNRQWLIIRQTLPIFVLSAIPIIFIVVLFFLTFRNWLKQKDIADMKSDFVNSITHEFHTPLAAIIVANRNLQLDRVSSDQEKVVSITKVIARQADRLRTLFDQVLNITSMQDLQIVRSDYRLHLLLDEILLDYRLKLNDPNVSITINAAAENDMIQVDSFWLTTMLNNIFDNAIRYNKSQQREILVNTFNESRKLVLVIEDNGIGMDENTRRRVFDKFYRHGDVLGTKGLGLGLYYVKQCVAAHGWEISIESEPQRGSRFIIIIPIG